MNTLTSEQGKQLLKLARATIRERLGLEPSSALSSEEHGLSQEFATFVTLKKKGMLRGCIGSLVPTGSVYESIRQNAVKAAFYDTRFPPVTTDEEADLHIDISILTSPKQLKYSDSADLISKLRPGVDGVTIRQGMAAATFLPQVWQQLSSPDLFLSHLCNKAGLASDAWKESHLDVETYQVQCFEEENS